MLDVLQSTVGTELVATKTVALLCVAVFMLSVLGKGEFPIWFGQSARASELVRWGGLMAGAFWFEPWRHLAAVFVHANALHILFNMMALSSFGRTTEGSLGPGRFAVVFVVSGVLGYVVSDFWYLYGGVQLTVGASGAVFGVLGASGGEAWARQAPDWKARVGRAFGLAVLLFLLFGLGAGVGINNAAHFGGLLAGVGLGYAFGKERRPHLRDRVYNWAAVGLLGVSVVSVLACNWSPAWQMLRQEEIARNLR